MHQHIFAARVCLDTINGTAAVFVGIRQFIPGRLKTESLQMKRKNTLPTSNTSPFQFMRNLRPEYYPDTKEHVAYVLEKPFFDYHLETTNSQNQTDNFEIFCRKLRERTICPKLRAHADSHRNWSPDPASTVTQLSKYLKAQNGSKQQIKTLMDNVGSQKQMSWVTNWRLR